MIDFLQAAAPAQPQPGFMQQYSFIIMIGLMVLVLWLFMWRPEAKRRKQMQAFRDGLKKGDKIITAGGIYGTVKEVKETTLLIEVDGGISAHNARLLFDTGADVLVAGNAVFGADDPKAEIERMLDV